MNNNDCIVSIVVPVYNASLFLNQCIQSIIRQDYENWELILINDGSTDESLDICRRYVQNDSRIKVFSQENKGVSSARNLGIKQSSGKYIAFVDSDDYVEQNYISSLISKKTHGYSMVVLGMKKRKNDGSFTTVKSRISCGCYSFVDFVEYIIDDGSMSGFTIHSVCSVLYDLDIIKKHDLIFSDKIKYNEDGLFNIQYFLASKKDVFIDYQSLVYIYNDNSSSATKTVDLLSEQYLLCMRLVEERLLEQKNITISDAILEKQIKRRQVTLFLEVVIYLLYTNQLTIKRLKELAISYKVVENSKELNFKIMNNKKRVIAFCLRHKCYFLLLAILKFGSRKSRKRTGEGEK